MSACHAVTADWLHDDGEEDLVGADWHQDASGYLQLGMANYLVFDPYGDLLGEQCRGWQVHRDGIRDWRPDDHERYRPLGLPTSLRPEGRLLRVFDPEGRPVLLPFELGERVREQARDIAHLRAELERLRAEHEDG